MVYFIPFVSEVKELMQWGKFNRFKILYQFNQQNKSNPLVDVISRSTDLKSIDAENS